MRTLNRSFRVLSFAAALVALACTETTTPPEMELASPDGGCSGKIDVHVSFSANGAPSFDWAPRCGVSWLTVQTVPPMGAMPVLKWAVSAPELSPIKPVIDYGVRPAGGNVQTSPTALSAGVTYRISVDQTVGLDVVVAHGDRTFTIP
jgi:hypothetical protein